MRDTWQSEETWIAIGRPQSFVIRGAPNDHPIVIGRSRSIAILETRGVLWCVRSPSRGRLIFIVTISIGRRRCFLEERRDRGAIEPRSHHDRFAIERRLQSFNGGNASKRPDDDRRSTRTNIMARSRHDRGPIVARSRPDRGPIAARSC